MNSRALVNSSPKELLLPDIMITATNINQPPLPSAPQLSPHLLSPLPRRPSLVDFTSHLNTQNESPLLSQVHKTNFGDDNVTPSLWSPANAVCHPTEPSQGYGRLRHLDRMKREQYMQNAHEPLAVKWDMKNLSLIIDVLEACGNGPPRVRKTWLGGQAKYDARGVLLTGSNPDASNVQKPHQDQRSKFDPRAPHFDVILLDLTNALSKLYQKEGIGEDATSDSGSELNKSKKGRLNRFLGLKDHQNPTENGLCPNIKDVANATGVRRDINELPMESLAGRPGWLFLWVGTTENMVEGRQILGRFGFRKVECIGWMKTTNGCWKKVEENLPDNTQHSSNSTGRGVLRRGVEWCLVGVKGTAKRTYDSHLIHCNVNTDVIICDGPEAPKSSLLSKIIENFSQGQRRLHLFANPGDERPGWVCIGKDFEETTFNCRKYMKFWEDKGKHGWLMPFDPEIEYFRPKTPPLQVRKRERAGLGRRNTNGGSRWEDELPRFPHPGQRKRPIMRQIPTEDEQTYRKGFTANITNVQPLPAPEYKNGPKPIIIGPRITQLSRSLSNNIQYQGPHNNQPHNFQQRRVSEPSPKSQGPLKKFQPSPTAEQFHPKNFPQYSKLIHGSKYLDTQLETLHDTESPMGNSCEYLYQARVQSQKILTDDLSIPLINITPPPDAAYQHSQYQYLSAPPLYPSTNLPSLGSHLSMYSDSRQLDSPPPYHSPSDYAPREFFPGNFPLGGPGRIRTANAARLATYPPVFRTEYRQSQRHSESLSGYYGNLNLENPTNPEYTSSQRSFDGTVGYAPINNIELDSNNIPIIRAPEQYQTPHYQQLPVYSAPPGDHMHQGPQYQDFHGIQHVYTNGYGQSHQYQLQVPNAPHPGYEPFTHQNQQIPQQQPQFGQYGTYGFQNQQPQNILQSPWFPEQVDYSHR